MADADPVTGCTDLIMVVAGGLVINFDAGYILLSGDGGGET